LSESFLFENFRAKSKIWADPHAIARCLPNLTLTDMLSRAFIPPV